MKTGNETKTGTENDRTGIETSYESFKTRLRENSRFLRVSFITLVSRLVRKGQLVDDFQY